MPIYSDYEKILNSINFTGGAGKIQLTPISGDDRTIVTQSSGITQIDYMILSSLSDFNAQGYYPPFETNSLPGGTPTLTASQIYIVQNVLHTSLTDSYSVTFEDVANVQFNVGNATNANITIGQVNYPASPNTPAYEYDASEGADSLNHGDVWLSADASISWLQTNKGTQAYITIMHEIGHALGLRHTDPIENENSNSVLDNQRYSVMSYNLMDGMNASDFDNDVTPFGLQLLDIAALQEIYGRNYDTRIGNTSYSAATAFGSTRPNGAFIYTIWDGGGNDTIDASAYTNNLGAVIDLRQGEFSSVGYDAEGGNAQDNLAIAFHAIIENATGTANGDILIGNAWNNTIIGGGGNDRIFGDGIAISQDGLVSQIKDAGVGFGTGTQHESGSGIAPATDGSGNDVLFGGSGDDIIYGGAGDDFLRGGAGNDIFVDGTMQDTVDYSGDPGSVDAYLNNAGYGRATDGYGGSDMFNRVGDILLSGHDDTLSMEYSMTGLTSQTASFMRVLDGGAGNDTFKTPGFALSPSGFELYRNVYDGSTGQFWNHFGTQTDIVKNFETYDIPDNALILLPDLSKARMGALEGVDYYGADFSGLSYGVTFEGGFLGELPTVSGGGNTQELTLPVLVGTNHGDFFDLGFVGYAYSHVEIITGKGDDIVKMYPATPEPDAGLVIYYTGGNDTYYLTEPIEEVRLHGSIRREDIQIELVGDASGPGASVDVRLNIAGYGVLDLNYEDSYPFSYKIVLGSGGSFQVNLRPPRAGEPPDFGFREIIETTPSSTVTLANFMGSWGDDQWTGRDTVNETYYGRGGEDILSGAGGNDKLYGGGGEDTLIGGVGNDSLDGGLDSDVYRVGIGEDIITDAGGDNDVLEFEAGINPNEIQLISVTGGHVLAVNGSIQGSVVLQDQYDVNAPHHIESIRFGNGLQTSFAQFFRFMILPSNFNSFTGSESDNYVLGSNLNSFLVGNGGDDIIVGGKGIDIIQGGNGNDKIFGGGGSDTSLDGGSGNDEIHGGDGNDTIVGGAGDDQLYGDEGNDNISSGSGTNYLYGGNGNDGLFGGGEGDFLFAGAGFDQLFGSSGSDWIDGGEGIDGAIFNGGSQNVVVDLEQGIAANDGFGFIDQLTSIENVFGGSLDDFLKGNAESNTLSGNNGNDTLQGGGGDDRIFGGRGNDIYIFNPGDGNDTVDEVSGDGIDTLRIGGGLHLSNLSYSQVGNDLVIHIASGVTIIGQFSGDPARIVEQVQFDDGSIFQLPNPFMQTNQPPIAVGDEFTMDEDTLLIGNVMANDSDPNGDTLGVLSSTLTTTAGGIVVLHETGDFTYTPALNFSGSDSFEYTLSDALGETDTATVTITIAPVNDAPLAMDDSFTSMEDASLADNLLSNDLDVDDIVLSALAGTFTTLYGGTVAIAVDGSFIYTAATNFNGMDSFDYTVRDAAGSSDIGKALVNVMPVNDGPDAKNDNFTGTLGHQVNGNLLSNNGHGVDSDVDGNSLSVQAGVFTTAQGQTVTVNPNGTFTYAPAFDFLGNDSFSYTLNDGQGGSDTATAYFSIKLPAGAKTGHAGTDILFGGNGDNVIAGLGGDDMLYGGKGNDVILGGAGSDLIFGGKGNDKISGGAGDDFIHADGGKDELYGGAGDDWLMGSSDNDILHGDAGRDTLFGGGGKNIYVFDGDTAFSGADTIMDFDKKRDQIDISDVLHNFDPLHDAIAHFVKVTTSQGKTTLSVDADGTDNGAHFAAIAIIQGAGKLDLASMINQDNLIF